MSTYTYDSGNFPAFTYTPDYSTWTVTRELPRRPRVGPWRYKRYRKRSAATSTMSIATYSPWAKVPLSVNEYTSTNTLTETEVPRRSYWRRVWGALLGR
jgi:hypothetical protein